MRLVSTIALMTSALALAACAGGGGGLSGETLSTSSLTPVTRVCPITPVDNTPDNDCIPQDPVTPTTPSIVDEDGDGQEDGEETDDDGNTGSGAGGNTTGLATGNKAIVLKKFVLDRPTTAPVALTTLAATEAEILSGSKPDQLTLTVDTKSGSNGNLPTPIAMNEFRVGTRDLDWLSLGHDRVAALGIPTTGGYPDLLDPAGNRTVRYDVVDRRYEHTAAGSVGGVSFAPGQMVAYRDDYYWNQLVGMMDSRANGGAGGNYREYRAYSESDNRDEMLQVWAWNDSYAIQYQNAIGGGDPKHQAWTFGGRTPTAMPTAGNATYNGRFVGTAKTENWVGVQGSQVDPNALWRVQGRSNFTADFTTGAIRGTLSPESWTSRQESNPEYTWFTSYADNPSASNPAIDPSLYPNYGIIYETRVNIEGQIDTANTVGNTFTGTATLDDPYITGDNPAYGGFYGTNGNELTGIFNADGATLNPNGGSTGIVDNTRGYLNINGAFNANCLNPGGVCAP
jgi:hypothetical protein